MHPSILHLLALAEPLLQVNPFKLEAAVPLLAPIVLFIAWWRGWFSLGAGGSGSGKSRKANSKPGGATGGGGGDLEPPIYLMLALCVFFAFAFAAVGLQSLPESLLGSEKSLQRTAAVTMILYTFGGAAVLVIGQLIAAKVGSAAAGWVTIKPLDIIKGIALVVFLFPALALVNVGAMLGYKLITGNEPEQIAHEQLRQILDNRTNPWAIGLIAAAVLGAPLVEEFIYRGLLLRGVLKASQMPWLSVIITSVLFAGVHVGSAGPHALPVLFALAVAMAITLVRTNKLGLAVGMHVGFNAINVLLAFWLQSR